LISRILLPVLVTLNRSTIIHLGYTLPCTSSNLPENLGGQPSNVSLFGLAPDGVYQAFPVTWKTGALLPHRFTLTRIKNQYRRSILCCTFLHVTVTPRYGASCPMVFGLSSRFNTQRSFCLVRPILISLYGIGFYCIVGTKSTISRVGPRYTTEVEYS